MTKSDKASTEATVENDDRQCGPNAPRGTKNSTIDIRAIRLSALSDGPERDYHLERHPLNQRPVKIITESIKRAFIICADAIKSKRPGCAFSAQFRSGKSTALLMAFEELPTQTPNVALGLISAKDHDTPTERVFWGDLLIALGFVTDGTAQERQNRLRVGIIAACIQAGGRQFCLLIDEGQNWGIREYTFLRDLANQLREQDGYILTTIIFGDPRLEILCSLFREKRKDLWARFLMKPIPFQGIRDVGELHFFLREHDRSERCEYPAGSGISYTEFFLPRAYAGGWRLETEAQAMWDAFIRAAAAVNQKVDHIGMQWVGEAVIDFFMDQMKNDVEGFKVLPEVWDEAVKKAEFVNSIV